jgi:hypothetical protein
MGDHTMRANRVSNKDARSYVQRRVEFQGSNTFAREVCTDHSVVYAVFSYGEHFPMFVAETDDNNVTHWYANTEKWSRTTSKHQGQLHPLVERMVPMDTDRLKHIARGGLMELVQRGLTC